MRTGILTIGFLLLSLVNYAQIAHDLEIYSEDGLKFTLIVNGKTVNEEPASNIQLIDVQKDYVNAKIVFENAEIPPIERKALQIGGVGDDKGRPVSTVYTIKEKEGECKLRFASRTVKMIQNRPADTIVVPGRVIIISPF